MKLSALLLPLTHCPGPYADYPAAALHGKRQTQHIPLDYLDRKYNTGCKTTGRLTLETGKDCKGGLFASYKVEHVGGGFATHAFGMGDGGDIRKTIVRNPTARVTQKAIDTLHAQTFTPEAIAAIEATVREYYTNGLNDKETEQN